jgi:hypothetical protein
MSDESTVTTAEAHGHEKKYRIFVNTIEKFVTNEIVSYKEIVDLAYPVLPSPDTIFSVSYEKAKEPREGELVAGQTVEIKEGTEFDVTPTGKS